MCSVKCAAAGALIALVFAVPAAAQTAPPPTYAHDIAAILDRSCASCHRPGESGPFSLLTYDDAKQYAPRIAAAVRARSMPPWLPEHGYGDFANESRLTDEEIRLIVEWVRSGAPRGPASETPPPPHFTEG